MKKTNSVRDAFRKALALLPLLAVILVAEHPVHAQVLYGVDWDTSNLYKVSTTNASLTLVGHLPVGSLISSLEYRPSNGMLYGIAAGANAALYRINPSNANTTLVGPIGEFVSEGALVIAPDGTAYGTQKGSAGNPILFKINLDTAATTNVGVISGGAHDTNGLAWRSDNMLVALDHVSNSLLAINPTTASSSVITVLQPTVGAVGGMAAIGDNGYFSTSGPSGIIAGSNSLYSFNLFTGANALIGSFAPTITGTGISGLALVPIPEPATNGLTLIAALGILRVRRKSR